MNDCDLVDYITDDDKIVIGGELATKDEIIDYLKERLEVAELTYSQSGNAKSLLRLEDNNYGTSYTLWVNGIGTNDIYYLVADENDFCLGDQIRPQDYQDMEYVFNEMNRVLTLSY